MTYTTDRSRFLPDRLVRMAAVFAAAAAVVMFAAVAPPPSLAAAPASGDYSFDVQLRSGPNGALLVEANVFAPDGDRVMSAKAATRPGQPVRLSTASNGRTYRVDFVPSGDAAMATLDVLEGESILFHSSRPVHAYPSTAGSYEGISLNLREADVHDVLRTFAQLTGRKVVDDPELSGKVSINVTNTPWNVALNQVLNQLGYSADLSGGDIRVVRAKTSADAPAGYMRLNKGMTPPEVLKRVEPVYPPDAKAAGISGIVIVQANIDETGIVRDVTVLKPLPYGLDKAAADAVRQWVFAPGLLDGKPVPVTFNLVVNFRPDANPESK